MILRTRNIQFNLLLAQQWTPVLGDDFVLLKLADEHVHLVRVGLESVSSQRLESLGWTKEVRVFADVLDLIGNIEARQSRGQSC